ncbi:contact-dependent growth inhibition system immunity protein [Lewinella sp. 4G2]|uniref:contact-dependent growth inhibition system immunity protein n=1 Tax=Lewinella sp. 4G2 TaxID=1803372 RepID=UPI0007B4B0E4|nr:contact-dependent growth inhibition system immunity protein [Lewinella sp. 4G2]OAV43914.1 hypothetical protein A3850_005140 [Lewinella sp. 4G2]
MNNITLSEKAGLRWLGAAPADNDSYVLKNSFKLYNKAISDLDVEDVRFLISQRIGLLISVPIALDFLEKNILAEGDYYEGDLLKATLNIPKNFWLESPSLALRITKILKENKNVLNELMEGDDIDREIGKKWIDMIS